MGRKLREDESSIDDDTDDMLTDVEHQKHMRLMRKYQDIFSDLIDQMNEDKISPASGVMLSGIFFSDCVLSATFNLKNIKAIFDDRKNQAIEKAIELALEE
jgi:hypothetical protein